MGLFGKGPDFGEVYDNINRNRGLYESIELPEYDEYAPELYDYESANYELAQDDPLTKSMQLDALARMQGLSESGLSAADEAGFLKARQLGDQVAKSKTDAAIADSQVRGTAGGGQEFAMREAASQAAAQRAQEAATQQAAQAAERRAQYLNAYANQAAGARDQSNRMNQANADVINRFNTANTQGRNQTSRGNVDARNDAFMYNQGLKDKRYQNQLGRADRTAGLNDQASQARLAEQDADSRQRQSDINNFMGLASMGLSAYGKK